VSRDEKHFEVLLPDGSTVWDRVRKHAVILFTQVQGYFNDEVKGLFREKPVTVFDVGANIGLFTREAMKHALPGSRFYTFEPIPETFDLLRKNVIATKDLAVQFFNFALGSEGGSAVFDYLPQAAALASMRGGFAEHVRESLLHFMAHPGVAERHGIKMPWYLHRLPPSAQAALVDLLVASRRKRQRQVVCPVTTLSEAMEEQRVKGIDLLKIDVEGAEWEVLKGIRSSDWMKIRSLVIEVHDMDGRMKRVADLLNDRGFKRVYSDKKEAEEPLANIFGFRI
jgi:FkbM family methyltransferase